MHNLFEVWKGTILYIHYYYCTIFPDYEGEIIHGGTQRIGVSPH